jgi:hypothetical protein
MEGEVLSEATGSQTITQVKNFGSLVAYTTNTSTQITLAAQKTKDLPLNGRHSVIEVEVESKANFTNEFFPREEKTPTEESQRRAL